MFRNQPKIEVKLTSLDKKIISFGWVFVGLNFLIALYAYMNLPETIPIHFNLKGEADGYGSKSTIWLSPIMGGLIYWGMNLILKKLKPWYYNYPVKVTEKNAETIYKMSNRMIVRLNVGIVLLFLAVTLQIIAISNGFENNLSWMFIAGVILLCLYPFYVIIIMFSIPR